MFGLASVQPHMRACPQGLVQPIERFAKIPFLGVFEHFMDIAL
jgi:hypothetical protein